MVVVYAVLTVFASLLPFVHRSGLLAGYGLIVGYGFYHGYALPVIMIASFGPAVVALLLFIGVTILRRRGHFEFPMWLSSLDEELHGELAYWELEECAKASSDEDEFQEMVSRWADLN